MEGPFDNVSLQIIEEGVGKKVRFFNTKHSEVHPLTVEFDDFVAQLGELQRGERIRDGRLGG